MYNEGQQEFGLQAASYSQVKSPNSITSRALGFTGAKIGLNYKFLDLFFANTWEVASSHENAQGLVHMYQLGLLEETSTPCLRDAVSALSLSNVGHDTADEALLREGMARYGHCLKGLRYLLSDPAKVRLDVLLTTACLIGLYEVRLREDISKSGH